MIRCITMQQDKIRYNTTSYADAIPAIHKANVTQNGAKVLGRGAQNYVLKGHLT